MKRKIIQFETQMIAGFLAYFALADDGTLWRMETREGWKQIEGLPDAEPARNWIGNNESSTERFAKENCYKDGFEEASAKIAAGHFSQPPQAPAHLSNRKDLAQYWYEGYEDRMAAKKPRFV